MYICVCVCDFACVLESLYRERERGWGHTFALCLFDTNNQMFCVWNKYLDTLYLQMGLTQFLPHEMMHLLRFWPTCPLLLLMILTSKVCIDFQFELFVLIMINKLSKVCINMIGFTEILMYHVVPGVWFSSGLTDGMSLPTLAGTNLTISVQGSGKGFL